MDATLGQFAKSSGYWRGSVSLASVGIVPLLIKAGFNAPDKIAVKAIIQLLDCWHGCAQSLQQSLFEHYSLGPTKIDDYPKINSPQEVWQFISVIQILTELRKNRQVVELQIRTEWDLEHVLGARFVDSKLEEICGSVLVA